MTNHWIDLQNSDVVMIMGSNAAENHPISMKWLTKARERGCKVINVDPRFTRSSSFADLYVPLRSGTDIPFVGGIINYALQNDIIQKEYVVNYTNAGFIIKDEFEFHDGVFSGYDPKTRKYDKSSWQYVMDEDGIPRIDKSLKDPRCVYQLMKKHFSRYDIDSVCSITGSPRDKYKEVIDLFLSTAKPERVATWMYAMGSTQHTHGTQNIRTYAILQLLMGNIGMAGGGINALRGESNVQGSTDMCLLFHILPGYLKSPTIGDQSLCEYLEHYTPTTKDPKSANWWCNYDKYIVSLLKAWYGDHAKKSNDFCYDYVPKHSTDCSHISLFEAMYAEQIKGLILFGQNPAVAGPNANKERKALEKLDWMVAVDLWETETSTFWKRPGVDPGDIDTEVFLLPACSSIEKEGSITNSGRWGQWRYRAIDPIGDSMPDLWILDSLFKSLKKEYKSGGMLPEAITMLQWDYGTGSEIDMHMEPDVHMVAKEVNGYFVADAEVNGKKFKKGDQIPSFAYLLADGSTCSGNWLYCNSYTGPDREDNKMARRGRRDAKNGIGLYPDWAWCWPVNRRIIYNRASVDLDGKPWNPDAWVIRWDPGLNNGKGGWEGDVPDGGWAPGTKYPFIMKPDGHAWLWAKNLADGPLPEHYEPIESPVENSFSSSQNNPAIRLWHKDKPEMNPIGDYKKFPIVGTTYRVSEHWQAGAMTRNLPWLAELCPDCFVELSEELAREKGIKQGDMLAMTTARGKIKAYALVTNRFKPFKIRGKKVHQVGVVWHFGWEGIATGSSANVLTPHVGDANTMIPEYKAFLCDIRKEGGA